jgi:hypothetical protein
MIFGGLAIMVTCGDFRPVGFASPVFTGFAFIGLFSSISIVHYFALNTLYIFVIYG